jgi:hypothetical protein
VTDPVVGMVGHGRASVIWVNSTWRAVLNR